MVLYSALAVTRAAFRLAAKATLAALVVEIIEMDQLCRSALRGCPFESFLQ
jgi:hypothetical protein